MFHVKKIVVAQCDLTQLRLSTLVVDFALALGLCKENLFLALSEL